MCFDDLVGGTHTWPQGPKGAASPRSFFFFHFVGFVFLKGGGTVLTQVFLSLFTVITCKGEGERERDLPLSVHSPNAHPCPSWARSNQGTSIRVSPWVAGAQAKHLLPEILTAPAGPQRPRQRSRTPPGTSRLATGGQPTAAGGVPHSHPTPVSHRSQAERLPSPPSLPRQCLRILPRRRR